MMITFISSITNQKIKCKKFIFCCCFIFSAASVVGMPRTTYPVLEKYVKMKQYQSAYQRALQLQPQNEGDPRFDYLFGLSALETGHYNEAVFALDRVTVAMPEVIRPRLELARAYLKINNRIAALKQFKDVLALSPPPEVRKNVSLYIAGLNNKSKFSQQTVVNRLASFSIGYDDNINFGSDNSRIDLPGLGLVTLNSSAIKQKSGFAEANFQIIQRKLKNKVQSTFLIAKISHRHYFKNADFNFSNIDLRAGFETSHNNKQYQLIARDNPVFLNGSLYSNTLGFDAVIRKSLSLNNIVSASLGIENYDNKKIALSDRKRFLFGLKLDQVFGDIQQQYKLHLGKEFAKKTAGKAFSRNILGAGYKLSYDWDSKNTSYLNLDYLHYKHQAPYSTLPAKRKDNKVVIQVTHEVKITKKATLEFSAIHTRNNSNLDLYDVKRNEIKAGIRYEWD